MVPELLYGTWKRHESTIRFSEDGWWHERFRGSTTWLYFHGQFWWEGRHLMMLSIARQLKHLPVQLTLRAKVAPDSVEKRLVLELGETYLVLMGSSLKGPPSHSTQVYGRTRDSVKQYRRWDPDWESRKLLEEIYDVFGDVNREGGVSWSASVVLDMYGTQGEWDDALRQDKDARWQVLVDDEGWRPDQGVGGWSFLDPIGFRYYLPAAMIRCVRSGYDRGIQYHLTLEEGEFYDFTLLKWSLLDTRQIICVKHFLAYMTRVSLETGHECNASGWAEAFDSYWSEV